MTKSPFAKSMLFVVILFLSLVLAVVQMMVK